MRAEYRRFLVVTVGCVGLACALGIGLDLVTANVAVEYFTVHHPRIVGTENPFLQAIVWGIAASWWCGAIAGVVLGAVNHRRRQPLPPVRILKWAAVAAVVLWLVMIAVLVAVLVFAATIPEEIRRPTFDYDRRIMAVAMAHQFEYLLAGIALVILALMTWRKEAVASNNLHSG